MNYAWVVVVALLACSGKKDADKGAAKAPPADEFADDPLCGDKVPPFAEWMKALVADGHVTVVATGIDLAILPGIGPTPITRGAPVVTVKPTEIVVEGAVVADPSTAKPADLAKLLGEQLAARPGPDLVLVIDGKVAWSSVVPLLRGAAAAKHDRVTFVFAAGAPGAASTPPKSSIDAELSAAAGSGADPDGAVTAKVFANCITVTEKLFPAIDKLTPGEFDVAVAVGMPEEIDACGCKVELPAVQRLMWAWWGRDRGPALAAIKVQIAAVAKDGTEVTTAPTAPWSEAFQLVAAAAERGKPIAPR